jgi:signal transduction histidine kinase
MTNDFKNLDVLIVEDSRTQAMMLKDLLELHKMNVTVAVDGIEALKSISENLPQIIISDIEMPNMNGYELCKMIRGKNEFKKLPVILLTSLKDPLDAIRGIECGANSFLTKPCDTGVLLSTINNAMANKDLSTVVRSDYQMEFYFSGQRHLIKVDQFQITELLLSTYSNAVQKNEELEAAYKSLNQLYGELKQKNDSLKKLDEQKNKFLGMAAHDMRNPLGAMKTFCELLLSKKDPSIDAKSKKIIDHIKQASTFMLHLVNDLLDISVIESGTIKLVILEVDLAEIIKESLEYLIALADKKQIHIKFKYEENQCKIQCDPDKISQVFANLMTNAIKFSHPGEEIEVVLIASELEMTIAVRDFGTGISPEMKQKMFQPFAKGASFGTKGEECTGLGLAIVHKIVSEHKGRIQVESELQKGTTFYVTLPREHASVHSPETIAH